MRLFVSDYEVSKKFYTEVLDFTIRGEYFPSDRQSFKLDLMLGDDYVVELFSFRDPPKRSSAPEACGLRHLAFEVDDIEATVACVVRQGDTTEGDTRRRIHR